jgi:hypothetical protein
MAGPAGAGDGAIGDLPDKTTAARHAITIKRVLLTYFMASLYSDRLSGFKPGRSVPGPPSPGGTTILGAAGRVGSLEPGKDADIVVLDGDPFDYRTRVVRVFIDGRPVRVPEPLR